ncbi:D-xylose 1-dehydrogenase Gfo6 [Halomicrobium salinisoli]|uniref:D-xylose 1-dehydrogenase Gfo6 n=1 Tax=Halomicrobium salinisoli TaxID=2878391 RepID=UPI001CEFBBB5|nr:D-xylose 1-dehydrogenase Gfo6 [Halomicrobium salinisoli]
MDLEGHFDDFERRDWEEDAEGTVRFAMIGLGWWTREYAVPATEKSDICDTTVVVSSSTEKAEDFAADFDGIEAALTYDEFQDGAATEHYDAVYIATPNALHLPYVESAAEYGKDILLEKPMEASVERAEGIVEAVEASDETTLMVAYRMHTDPAVRRMRDLIESGFIGEPAHVHGHMSQPLLEMIPDPDQWRLNPDLAGPGASVTDLGVYPINTARFVLDRDPVAVQAATYSGAEGFEDVPDERAAFTVTYEDDVLASMSASQNAHTNGFLRITGTEGELKLEPAFLKPSGLTVSRGDVDAELDLPDWNMDHQMDEEFEYFANHVLTDRQPTGSGEHGLVDMQLIEAVFESAERGERIDL